MHSALHIAHQNLFDIGYYANLALDQLEPNAGELPQWMNNKVSIVRTHMKDVGHFVRFQAHEGKSFAGDFDPGYIARKNLREIAQYADAVLSATKRAGSPLPAWANHKLSSAAELMDCVGHTLVNEAAEGRRYGGGHGGADALQSWIIREAGWNDGRRYGQPKEGPEEIVVTGSRRGLHRFVRPRRFGVPGIPFPEPGWAGQGGVAAISTPSFPGRKRWGVR